jgi:aspartate-semialdehyde dehydrogenase
MNIAIVGATGKVGQTMLAILQERNFPAQKVFAVASEKSEDTAIKYGEQILKVQNLETFDFSTCSIALFSPGAQISAIYAPRAAAQGCIVIDNTSQFRTDPEIPLVIPEVNAHVISQYKKRNIIANPNCSTIQMLVVLKPLHDVFKIKRIVVSTYQSVSGAGKNAMLELDQQAREFSQNQVLIQPQVFSKQILFNAIPHIDVFMDDGATKEEWKMNFETKKILDPNIAVHANCARIGSFVGHAEYVNIETEKTIVLEEVYKILAHAPGVNVIDRHENSGYITPVEAAGKDDVFVSRIRQDYSVDNGLSFWCVADNLRKGAALNAVQIAEILLKNL